jgi:hypothetical protein
VAGRTFLVRSIVGQRCDDVRPDLLKTGALFHEDLARHARVVAEDAEEQVLRPYVVVRELAPLVDRQLDHFLRTRRQRDLARGRRRLTLPDHLFDSATQRPQADAEGTQGARGNAFTLAHEPEQQMLGADVVVVEADRFVLSEREHTLRAVVETVEWSLIAAGLRRPWLRRPCWGWRRLPGQLCEERIPRGIERSRQAIR